ncbi:hypothetical protein BHE74_00029825 [Ensete ventricosum]|nr:hypothetical protein BHE74_00029825 [Ensete ventricosum]
MDRLKELIKYKAYQVRAVTFSSWNKKCSSVITWVSCRFHRRSWSTCYSRYQESLMQLWFRTSLPASVFSWLLSSTYHSLSANHRYPDAEAGQIPVAFIVRQPGHDLTEAQVMGFVAEKVVSLIPLLRSSEPTKIKADASRVCYR